MSLVKISTMAHLSPLSRTLIEKYDSDRYFLSLLAPTEKQADLWPIIAFYHEIARTREMVTDTTMGLIRLQWWKDSVRAFYTNGVMGAHEIFPELARVITAYKLPYELFENLLIAREFDVEDKIPSSIDGLKNYIHFTHTPFVKLLSIVLGTNSSSDDDIQNISFAYGIIGILRAFVFHARARRCYLPADHIKNIDDIYAFKQIDELKPLVKILCDMAVSSLNKTRSASPFFKGMKSLVRLYIAQIKSVDYNLIAPQLLLPPQFKQLRVWWQSRFGC